MKYQKTYHKQSANQIIKGADITVMNAGNAEITHPDWPGCIFMQSNDGNLIIENFDGIVVRLICGIRAAKKLQALADACETKQIQLLKAKDAKNGTTYAEYL